MTFIKLLFAFLFLSTTAHAQSNYSLAKNKHYNELEENLRKQPGKDSALWTGILKSAFNQPVQSERLLTRFNAAQFPDSIAYLYLNARYDNNLNLFNYRKGADIGEILITKYKRSYTPDSYQTMQEDVAVWKTVSAIPPQELQKNGDNVIPLMHDKFGLQKVTVKVEDKDYDFVFDTGASICTVIESFAKKIGVKIISDSLIYTKAIAGNIVSGRMGVLDELSIGNIKAQHVLFYVFPDSVLSFAGGQLVIPAILGFPVIKSFGTFTQTKTAINIPAADPVMENVHHNFIVQDQVPIIYLKAFDREVPFAFDTGDNDILLNKIFYETFRSRLKGKFSMGSETGAGGSATFKALVLDSLTLFVGAQPATFKKISVNTENYHISGKEYYGNIGQALITKFRSMTISFTNARISFE